MLENCKHYDKDYRHTGAHDCCNEILNSVEPLEESFEKRICQAFIAQLIDESVEVKSNAVKCIQRVTTKIREVNLIMILEKLADEITNEIDDGGKKALAIETIDIFALTVRGIINES